MGAMMRWPTSHACKRVVGLAIATTLTMLAGNVQAGVVTYQFTGMLDSAFGTLAAGSPFTGYLMYESPPTFASKHSQRSGFGAARLSVTAGSETIIGQEHAVHIKDDLQNFSDARLIGIPDDQPHDGLGYGSSNNEIRGTFGGIDYRWTISLRRPIHTLPL